MSNDAENSKLLGRRNLLKALATVPLLGTLTYAGLKKHSNTAANNVEVLNALGFPKNTGLSIKPGAVGTIIHNNNPHIRLGFIGVGGRGRHLMQCAGFAPPEYVQDWMDKHAENQDDNRYQHFLEQDDLNVSVIAVCDVFDEHARLALEAASNADKKGHKDFKGITVKRYKTYQELIADKDIDAVVIATPDHWHAPIAIAAANAGKHVYVEKPMTNNVAETYELKDAVIKSGIAFQVGHQGRQTESYIRAKEVLDKGVLGKISLIEVTTNRNSPNGAWVYDLHPLATKETIDWKQFLGNAPEIPFSPERFFRWRCWWDYASGLSGDLLTHEFDAINQVMNLGIPHSCVASGGVYFYKDGREVPDVFQAVFEYPNRDLTFLYSASLASERHRGKVFMGHDGSMDMDGVTSVYIDRASTKYKDLLDRNLVNPDEPALVFSSNTGNTDAITSPTAKYFAKRGLLYTYRDGKRYDAAHLHIREWLDAIRNKQQPSCDIQQGFEEAMIAHMATISYREGIKTYWDAEKEIIVKGNSVKM